MHELYLIRHLRTPGNEKRQYIGWTDERIAEGQTAPQLKLDVSAVYGSDLLRARETAAVYFPEASYRPDPRFRECHFGDFEGKTYEELKDVAAYRAWLDDPRANAPPGGELLAEMERRVFAAISEMPGGSAVITHGGPIRFLLTKFAGEPRQFWEWKVPHGSVWKLSWKTAEDMKEGIRCMSLSEEPITGNGSL